MSMFISEYFDLRIEEIAQDLKKANSEYALAAEKSKELMENIDPILRCDKDIIISAGDCLDFQEYLGHEFACAAVLQQELYKQGYLDCVRLLKTLGVIA